MFKWFSLSGIRKEVKERIRWPKPKEMSKYSFQVFSFVVFFMVYFIAADFIVAVLLRALGIVS